MFFKILNFYNIIKFYEILGYDKDQIFKFKKNSFSVDFKKGIKIDKLNKVIILFSSRSGSTFVCKQLEKFFKYGRIHESINFNKLINYSNKNKETNLNSIIEKILISNALDNNYCIFKTGVSGLYRMFEIGEFPKNLNKWKVVYLYRKDKISQAVSILYSSQSRIFHSFQINKKEKKDVSYNEKRIKKIINRLNYEDKIFKRFFDYYSPDYLKLSIEDIEKKDDGFVKILDFINLPNHCPIREENKITEVKKFDTEIKREWVKKYKLSSLNTENDNS